MNQINTQKLEHHLKQYVSKGLLSHFYVAKGSLFSHSPSFRLSFEPGSGRSYDLASLTKALVTAPLCWKLLLKNSDLLDQPIGMAYKNEKAPSWFNKITLKQLLTHTSGLEGWRSFWSYSLNNEKNVEFLDWIFDDRIQFMTDNKKRLYSDIGFMVLGDYLQRMNASTLLEQFSQLKNELDQNESCLGYNNALSHLDDNESFITTSYCKIRKKWLKGLVHDLNCFAQGGVCAHAGLFGSGDALFSYLSSLTQKFGLLKNPGVLTDGLHNVLGWDQGHSLSEVSHNVLQGHLGFTGTAFWVDLSSGDCMVFLTNRVISSRQSSWMKQLRKDVFSSLVQIK